MFKNEMKIEKEKKERKEEDDEDEDDENNNNYNDNNIPFSVLMQQACNLKTKQNEIFRRKFDLFPLWLQHTMFSDDIINEIRLLSYTERMKFAQDSKLKGNEYLKNENYYEAMNQYERGMSVFHWIVNKKENWKKQEIEDDMIDVFEYITDNIDEINSIKSFRCSCLLNMALVFQKLNQWNECIQACTAVIEMDPNSAKAYYRRAQARYLPIQCGAAENEIALTDLKHAYELSPNDKLITNAYFQLKKELDIQRKKDLTTFGGLFERGEIYKKEEFPTLKSENIDFNNMTIGDVLKKIRDMKSSAKTLYHDGKVFESNQLMERAESLQKEIEEYQASLSKDNSMDWLNIDYNNPTPQVIEMTTKMGLNLQDPRVVEYLQQVQSDLRQRNVQGNSSEAIIESIQSIQKNQLKQTATVICNGWFEDELDFFALNRLKYSSKYQASNYLLTYNQLKSVNAKRELLIESVIEDLIEIENIKDNNNSNNNEINEDNDNNSQNNNNEKDNSQIMKMLNERYGMNKLDTFSNQKKSKKIWTTFYISVLFFFGFFFIPFYLKSCNHYCKLSNDDECSNIFSSCSIYYHFFSSFYSNEINSSNSV